MKNITFDSTSFSEQLGLYDFFNVLVFGATFICGISVLNEKLCSFLWSDLTFQKGLGIILLIYIVGMILQEMGSYVDRKITKLYKGMHQSILKGDLDDKCDKETSNKMIKNPYVLKQYRDMADQMISKHTSINDKNLFENDYINGYVFSICQYYVSVKNKDKKSEKLRALFSMSKTLMTCFFLLAICAFLTLIFNVDMSIEICNNIGILSHGCGHCMDKIFMLAIFVGAGFAFYYRARRTMRNFLLILLGTYNAIVMSDEIEKGQEV